jgi:hypothetical protein
MLVTTVFEYGLEFSRSREETAEFDNVQKWWDQVYALCPYEVKGGGVVEICCYEGTYTFGEVQVKPYAGCGNLGLDIMDMRKVHGAWDELGKMAAPKTVQIQILSLVTDRMHFPAPRVEGWDTAVSVPDRHHSTWGQFVASRD